MSGIYIPDMEMPCGCMDCPVWAVLRCGSEINRPTRPPDCPLVDVPDHGRLIDADAYHNLLICIGNRDYRRERGTLRDAIKFLSPYYSKTIIPADKEDGE